MYWLAPSAGKENGFATWENGFTESEVSNIIQLGEKRVPQDGNLSSDGTINLKVRKSKVSWIESSDDSVWLYDKMAWITRQLNCDSFGFDLSGFAESFQYTVYKSGGDHYDWHVDKGAMNGSVPRKLSLVVMLSDPTEYEGGEFEMKTGNESTILKREKGHVIAFPSWVLHRVNPVTKGTRKTLVLWVGGPAFR